MKPLYLMATLSLLLAGCGARPVPVAAPVKAAAPAVRATAVTVAELAARWDRPENEGRRVRLEAAFVPHTYALGYGETYHGYRLQGADGAAVLCLNVFKRTGVAGTEGRDFALAARRALMGPQHPVTVEGVYRGSRTGSSHGGVYTVPAGVEVTAIDGRPLASYVADVSAAPSLRGSVK